MAYIFVFGMVQIDVQTSQLAALIFLRAINPEMDAVAAFDCLRQVLQSFVTVCHMQHVVDFEPRKPLC